MIELNRHIAPEIQTISSVKLIEPEKYVLSNGVPVYVFNNPNQDLLKLDIVFDAGTSMPENPLLASAVNNMLTEVTKNYDSASLAEAIDFYGAYLETATTRDHAFVSLYSLHNFLDKTLPLLGEVVKNANFEQQELDLYVSRKKQEFMVNSEKVDFIARQKFTSLLFGESHPYGKYSELEDYDKLKREYLVEFHQKYYVQGAFSVYVAGRFGQKEYELLNASLSDMANGEAEISALKKWKIAEADVYRTDIKKEGAVQNALRLGFVAPHRSHPDYFGLKILTTILGGYFGSRLMKNIREDKGYTYGIGASVSSFKQESVFFISTEIKSETLGSTLEEIEKEMVQLQTNLLSDEELLTVKNYLQGRFQRSFDGSFALLDRFKEVNLNNKDYSYYHEYIKELKNISADRIRVLAQKYCNFDKMFVLSVGN